MNSALYVVTSFFNPFEFKSRSKLYWNFKKHMEESGAKLFTVELAFGTHPFEVTSPNDSMNLQLRTNTILFHKERLLNLGIQRVRHIVPDAEYFGWFDADITFTNPDWVKRSVSQLLHHPVIQPFGTAVNLDINEEALWICPSSFKSFHDGRGYHQTPDLPPSYTYKGHPGLAWCATREALDSLGGLYDVCVAGSGDTVMSNCLKGDYTIYLPAPPSGAMISSMKTWQRECDAFVKTNVGYTPGSVLHHWHGKSETRGYDKRWQIMSYHQFDPAEDLMVDTNGLYRWRGNKPRMEQDIRLSLGSRDEDATR